jgi:hypothetical protein
MPAPWTLNLPVILTFLRNHAFKFAIVLLTLTIGLLVAALCKSHYDVCSPNKSLPCSTLEGRSVHLVPSGLRFDVPRAWLDWQVNSHNNFHLTRWQLYKVKSGFGEWDSEYAQVTNAVLPFEMCAVHAGGEGWGFGGVSFDDLQLRVYVGNWVLADLKHRIATDGLNQANRVAKHARSSSAIHDSWQLDAISCEVFYGDYGGTAHVDFYSRVHEGKTVVFVFMYALEHVDDIDQILGSFAWDGKSTMTVHAQA